MEYVDLNRKFLPIENDGDFALELPLAWGKFMGGGLDWEGLLNKKRVVLLAEALSGKTEEFKNNAEKLVIAGKAAFFIPIEELADEGFENSLDLNARTVFENWKNGFEEGYFFLDSVDEARLNRKRFNTALKKLSQQISYSLDRSRIFISCRVTDWKGREDEQAVKQLLPVSINISKSQPSPIDSETALLDPIFENKKTDSENDNRGRNKIENLTIIRLAPLDEEQQRKLAQAVGVEETSKFSSSIWQNGLESLVERPGDLIELAEFWKKFQEFGTLSEMTEHAILQKLSERDPYRPDNDTLTSEQAREGAERIAAALTLGKTFTLRPPGQASDPKLAADVLEPKKLIQEWSDAERNALLRRGVFAPATYGRVRFHHRSTQEYLAAQWFNNLLQKGCPRSEVHKILFEKIYGVETVVPSLRPVAAWLSLSHDGIRNEILDRDPLILIQYGDPGSLPVETRRRLLYAYAKKHQSGDIANDSLDHRTLWMFAHPDLAETIHEVWDKCTRDDFRGDLLRLIREGGINACADLASKVALDQEANTYHRIIAVQALNKCKSYAVLSKIASNLLQGPSTTTARLVSHLACELFPDFLNVNQLISLIVKIESPRRESTEGFGYALEKLWNKCPPKWRLKFLSKITNLALSKPFVDNYQRISSRYRFLAKHFEPIARHLITEHDNNEPNIELVHLLMAIERIGYSSSIHDDQPPLSLLVKSRPKLQRTLFWKDIEEARENKREKKGIICHWHVHFLKSSLWELGHNDLLWLYEDLDNRSLIDDKQVALSAIVNILLMGNNFEKEQVALSDKIKPFPILSEYLKKYLKPHEETDRMLEIRLHQEQHHNRCTKEDEEAKESWRKFRDELINKPSQILDPEKCFWYINNLTRWLRQRTNQDSTKAPRQWPLIEEAFNCEVAEAYRDAMKNIWRDTKPKRPRRKKNQTTTEYSTIYAYAAIGIEADASSNWAIKLSKREAGLAAQHGCISEQGYPDWLDVLLDAHSDVVLPIIKKEFSNEWKSKNDFRNDFLSHYAYSKSALRSSIATILFEIIVRSKPISLNRLDYGLQILQRMEFSHTQTKRLKKLALIRFQDNVERGEEDTALRYLSLLFQVNPQAALQHLKNWIEPIGSKKQPAIALKSFAVLFNRETRGMIADSLQNAPMEVLKDLILLAYRYVRLKDDNVYERMYSPDSRDDAESGRNTVLSALVDAKGAKAYDAMIELAEAPEIGESSHRFRQLARGMAERDAERPPWTEGETIEFENKYIAPIKTGNDLYRVVLAVLEDIRHQLSHGDTSSKRLLSLLAEIGKDDEESVQNWLAEQLTHRANGRYHIHREAEVANKDKPDIIVSGATELVEVAIEVKQADSWSPNELIGALTGQLAKDYLRANTRRHGILFMTDHGRRQWKDTLTRGKLSFDKLLALLSRIATSTTENSTGKVEISVFGIDLTK
ncbi:MAG: hypothetical protein GXP60_03040 [Epsilonproteobacteria bacterium]|nr:hypothetical protein [Campylobacterota bacterium]